MAHGMSDVFDVEKRRAIRMALALDAYNRDVVRIAEPDVTGFRWLVATHRGVFAVTANRLSTALHGWFFGICNHQGRFYLFENCALRDRSRNLGRIIKIDYVNGKLINPEVLVKGLHPNCHQVRVIDGLLCVVDTANQAIRRYTLEGDLVDVKHPFPVARPDDRTGAYFHLNSIARVGSRIAVMRHNGKVEPEKASELAWLDADWNLISVQPLDGHWCHDIVEDDRGVLWHCGSKAGEIIASDGRRIGVTEDMLTRGLGFADNHVIIGKSNFGSREVRNALLGALVFLDRSFNPIAEVILQGPPADIAPLLTAGCKVAG